LVYKEQRSSFQSRTRATLWISLLNKGNTRFMYVLPTSTTEALLEYTLFSHDLLAKSENENGIQNYVKTHH
jgi:lycopene beta-cyclase